MAIVPQFAHGGTRHGPTARNADRAVLVDFRRFLALIRATKRPMAQRAVWLRLLPMRAICRVRSRSAAAAGAVHVRVRAMACPSRSSAGERHASGSGLGPPGGELCR